MFKNETVYLQEWLEFHRSISVQKFYLCNHQSADHFEPVLEPNVA